MPFFPDSFHILSRRVVRVVFPFVPVIATILFSKKKGTEVHFSEQRDTRLPRQTKPLVLRVKSRTVNDDRASSRFGFAEVAALLVVAMHAFPFETVQQGTHPATADTQRQELRRVYAAVRPNSPSFAFILPQFQCSQTDDCKKKRKNPKPDHHLGFLPSFQLEMVMNR